MKKISSVLLVMLIITSFFACKKSEHNDVSNPSSGAHALLRTDYRMFNDEQIDSIGVLHNVYLTQAYDNFDFENYDENIKTAMFNINIGEYYGSLKDTIFNFASKVDYDNLDDYVTSQVKAYYDEALYVADTVSNLASLRVAYSSIEHDARTNLSGSDLDQVLMMLSVGINSATFWAPSEIGGNGIGYAFLEHIPTRNTGVSEPAQRSWQDTVAKDEMGALGSAVGWGIGTLIFGGPVGAGSYIFCVAWGAATASCS
ncbi:MAG TPA: hypothetical protein VL093_14925 [Flavipsychrobacter sp.]|nr:hypothetical protein [Flavipsychrobacter sp.]